MKRTFRRPSRFEVLRVGNPDAAIGSHLNAGGDGAWGGNFFWEKRFRVEPGETTGVGKNPDSMVGRQDQLAGHSAIEAVFRFPHAPAICLRIPHGDAIVGANPKAFAGIADL